MSRLTTSCPVSQQLWFRFVGNLSFDTRHLFVIMPLVVDILLGQIKQLLPMFRILLYKVATARREKDRLTATLRRWALESADNARLVVDVIAAFRRTEAKIDRTAALTLMAHLADRFPGEVELPFATAATFGYQG